MEEETVWLTQSQMAMLFGTQRAAITKHLNNIYNSGEIDLETTCSILEHMGQNLTLALDIERHNRQYPPIKVRESSHYHDRFLIIDDTVYHLGASLKDLGKKLFAFSRMELSTADVGIQ